MTTFNYFNLSEITTAEELKKAYRALCQQMHPDHGGKTEDFQTMKAEYEAAAAILSGETPRANRTTTSREAVGVRRGVCVKFFGGCYGDRTYIIISVCGDVVKLVRLFSDDFQSLEDVEYYDENDHGRRTLDSSDHLRPLSEQFGIGYYYDDMSGKIYTDAEINEAERVADNFDQWIEVKKQKEAEEARRAQEEADRAEAAIIDEWRGILEELPPLHQSTTWDELQKMNRDERKAAQDADRKAERRANAQRLAAFKRNIKAVFAHYFPGVKVTVSDTSKCWCESSVISWVDGPTVDDVKAVEAFDYFRACGWAAAGPCEDYGHRETRRTLSKFRKLFGAWSDDSIKFERTFSEATAANVDAVIASIIPDFAGKKFNDKIETTDEQAAELIKFFGFEFTEPWRKDMTEEEQRDHYARQREHEEQRDRIRRVVAPSFQQWRGECYWQSLRELFTSYYKMNDETTTTDTQTTERPQTEGAKGGEELTEAEAVEMIEKAEQAGTITRETVGDWFTFSGRGTFGLKKAFRALGGLWDKIEKVWRVPVCYYNQEPTFVTYAEAETEPQQEKATEPQTETTEAEHATEATTTPADADPLADELAEALRRVEEIRARMAEREAQRQADAERQAREAERAAAIAAAQEEAKRAEEERIDAQIALHDARRKAQDAADSLARATAIFEAAQEAETAAAARLADLMEPTTPAEGVEEFESRLNSEQADEDPNSRENVRKVFENAARRADELEEENDHTAAARELVMWFNVMTTRYFSETLAHLCTLDEIKAHHEKRGHIQPEEVERRACVAYRCAFLCVEEFGEELARVLFGGWVDGLTDRPEATAAA